MKLFLIDKYITTLPISNNYPFKYASNLNEYIFCRTEFYKKTDMYCWCQANLKEKFELFVQINKIIDNNTYEFRNTIMVFIEIYDNNEAILFKLTFGDKFFNKSSSI